MRKSITILSVFIIGIIVMSATVANVQKPQEIRKKAAPASILYFDPPSVSVTTNQSFDVSAMIDPAANSISAVELYVEYDARAVRLTSIAPSSSFSVVLRPAAIDHAAGKASIIVGTPPLQPVHAVSSVAQLSFVAASTPAAATLTFAAATKAAAIDETVNAIVSMRSSAIAVVTPTPTPTATPTHTPTPTPVPIPGDINRNGRVDIYDYNALVEVFGQSGSHAADLDNNGRVDIFDYNTLVANFGKGI